MARGVPDRWGPGDHRVGSASSVGLLMPRVYDTAASLERRGPDPLDPQGGETLWGAGQVLSSERAPTPPEPLSEALERRGQDLAAYWVREASGAVVEAQDREAAYRYRTGMGASQAVEMLQREYMVGYDDAEALLSLREEELARVLAHLRQSRDRVVGGGGPLWARRWARTWDIQEAPAELGSLSPTQLVQAFRDVYNSGGRDREGVVNAVASYYPLTRDQVDAILRGAASDAWAVDFIQRHQGSSSGETPPMNKEDRCGVVSSQLKAMPRKDAQGLLRSVYGLTSISVTQSFLRGYEGFDLASFLMSWPDAYLDELEGLREEAEAPIPTLWEHLENG